MEWSATYRLQLRKEFGFGDAAAIAPYLARLGISHAYTSPVLAARPGSSHGYDVVDPAVPNPELGGEQGRVAFVSTLRDNGLGWLLDIVPNHMGTGPANPYWEDVLANGRASRFANWFDVDWQAPVGGRPGRLMLPILGDELARVLRKGEITLERVNGSPRARYYSHVLPLSPETAASLPDDLGAWTAGPEGTARLARLLARQHYSLTFWRRGARDINYRRFFDVNDLAGLRTEDPAVFDAIHQRALEWMMHGDVAGLRVDHVDGLRDPLGYLDRLRIEADRALGSPAFIVVEKILSEGETLRDEWPIQGTTGYEFLNDLEALFVAPRGFTDIRTAYLAWAKVPGFENGFEPVAYSDKLKLLRRSFRADLRRLARLLQPVLRAASEPDTIPPIVLALERLIGALPVYRTYVDGRPRAGGVHPDDRKWIREALERALKDATTPAAVARFIASLLQREHWDERPAKEQAPRLEFIQRFQQTSGPATAKGVEDTALYQYVPLVSVNEVGGTPDRPLPDALPRFHESNHLRARQWPRSLLTTTTHDTKRNADVRARLDVLSEIPRDWIGATMRWRRMNRRHRGRAGRRRVPDPNTEYLLYQSLLGVWPLTPSTEGGVPGIPDDDTLAELRARIEHYMLKAAREAKLRTTWTDADPAYERALREFIGSVMDRGKSAGFLADVAALAARIGVPGFWNSLSRLALHLTAPGTPDIYQGDELWNFALVDPDNRRPVDYELRKRCLEQLDLEVRETSSVEVAARLRESPHDGRIKLFMTTRLLRARRERAGFFPAAGYEPLAATGPYANHVVSFARTGDGGPVVTIASRFPLSLTGRQAPSVNAVWETTRLPLPSGFPRRWHCVITGNEVSADEDGSLDLGEVLEVLPAAVLAP